MKADALFFALIALVVTPVWADDPGSSKIIVGTEECPLPPYPDDALSHHEGGTIQLKVTFDSDGGVRAITLTKSSGVIGLDASTKNFVYAHWRLQQMANQTGVANIVYNPDNPKPIAIDGDAIAAVLPPLPEKPKPAPKEKPEAELVHYKDYVKSVILSYWNDALPNKASTLEAGTVKISFTIHSDGTLSGVTVTDGDNLEQLRIMSKNALVAPAPFKPFPPELIKEVGESFTDSQTFTVSR